MVADGCVLGAASGAFWGALKPFLPLRTLNKVHLINRMNTSITLDAYLGLSNIETNYGGSISEPNLMNEVTLQAYISEYP